jgi:uncharacterized protein YdaT
MPWTGKEFASKHNKKLSGEQANKAAKIANAILRETGDDGKAIRIANSKFSGGGKVMKDKYDPKIEAGEMHKAHGEHAAQSKGRTKAKHFSGGGSVSARGDGIASKGKTRGKCC